MENGGSRSFLELNSNVSIKDLLLGLIVQSGNDAAVVLAEGISGDEEAFAREMNRYAKLIGMQNTYFTNSTGWPHPDSSNYGAGSCDSFQKIIGLS